MADLSQLDSKVEPLNEDFEGNSMNISGVPLSPLFPQDHSFLQQIMTSQEVKDMLANFKTLSQEKRDEFANALSASLNAEHGFGNLGDSFSCTASQILKILMTPATEHLPVLSSLTQELKIVKRPNEASPRNDDCDDSSGPPREKKSRIESESNTYLCIEPQSTTIKRNQITAAPVQTLYSTTSMSSYEVNDQPKPTHGIVTSVRDQYNNVIRSAGGDNHIHASPAMMNTSHYGLHGTMNNNFQGAPKLNVFLVPQDKGRSRNYDYVGGTVTDDPDSEYSLFCRGRPTVVPFAVGVQNVWPQDVKLKVQVVFAKIKNKVPVRCSNHKEGDNTIWRDQLMISTDPQAQSLTIHEGHGFMIQPVPTRCDVLFLCRNSCRQGYEKEWQLQFSLLNNGNQTIAVRTMSLRVCEVPHRDIMKSKVKYEWNPTTSTPEQPTMRLMACKEEIQEMSHFPRIATDVYPIYVSGYDSYSEIMQYVSNMEMRKKHENPIICRAVEHMRDWTRDTPILRFLQPVCGVETSLILEKFNRKEIRTLGDLYHKFNPEFFASMHISAALASNLSALYLNWRNIIEYYEMSVSKRDSGGL